MAELTPIAKQAQALLFSEGGSLSYAYLSKTLSCSEGDLKMALESLETALTGTGLALIRSDTEAVLAIAPDAKDAVVKKATEEYDRDIGDAGLEVLAVLLYEGPSTRATIDYIRGVNSSSTIRTLLLRGLVERSGNPEDGREYIYRATTDLLAHLGSTKRENLPEYDILSRELAAFKATQPEHGSRETA